MKGYTDDYYKTRHQKTVHSARTILSVVSEVLPEISSAVDLGCGVGTWLSVLKENGVKDVQGVDGSWVDKSLLEIPKQCFLEANIGEPIHLGRRYDLAISLEVAEHLPSDSARTFVKCLVDLSDFILFSAAIPFQGGRKHFNEQWPDYWARFFKDFGYIGLDFIRKEIWNDRNIPTRYRQNTLVFVKRERIKDLKTPNVAISSESSALSVVHPDTYLSKVSQLQSVISQLQSVKGSWRLFRRSLRDWFKRKLI